MESVGIIANPASGKDIRRIVTYSSSFDNQEKVNIIQRVIMALHATGVKQVHYMPEYYNIVPKALGNMLGRHREEISDMDFIPLDFHYLEKEQDTIVAGGMLRELGVGCIVTLGGDGTNRAVAKSCGDVPIVPISTGTNNVFPSMIEGTIAGMAAGIVAATRFAPQDGVFERRKRLDLYINDKPADMALIDMVILDEAHVGARAMWSADRISQIFVTQCAPYYIGISSIAGQYDTISPTEPRGMMLVLDHTKQTLRAVIAPGFVQTVGVESAHPIYPGDMIEIPSRPMIIAVDGERNLQIKQEDRVGVSLSTQGPVVVNIEKALEAAARHGLFMLDKNTNVNFC